MRRALPLCSLLAVSAVVAVAACSSNGPSRAAQPSYAVAVASPVDASAALAPVVDAASSIDPPDAPAPLDAAPPEPVDAAPVSTSLCNEQPPQDFLIRKNYIAPWSSPADVVKEAQAAHQRAIAYRTEHYGFVPGFGSPSMNPHSPSFYSKRIAWFGLPVVVHEKIVPALQCVEQEIKDVCADHPYTPHALAGIRFQNTYHTGEITNHMYGIAMDIDPAINSCCGCVPPWNANPLCHKKVSSEYERMSMPECWVHAFEKYGFYWLGHDVLQDTMHYEFLGDPDKILKNPPPPSTDAGTD